MMKLKIALIGPPNILEGCISLLKRSFNRLNISLMKFFIRSEMHTSSIDPVKGGKTTIANFLSDATDNSGNEYRPTQGVRIVEFESYLNINNRSLKVDIELWDCGGSKKFEKCWPACYKDANGVVFVYDPVSDVQITDLDYYYDHFVLQSGIQQSNCIVIAFSKQANKSTVQLGNQFSRITKITANIEEDGNKLRTHFNNYISGIMNRVYDTTEREELKIINIPFGP